MTGRPMKPSRQPRLTRLLDLGLPVSRPFRAFWAERPVLTRKL